MCVCVNLYISVTPKYENKSKRGGVDSLGPWARRSAQTQSHGPVSEACASRRRSKRRLATIKISWADFRSWGITWMGNIPRSAMAMEISTTNYDSCPTSVVRSPLILSNCVCSSASIASRTSRSVSCRQRRIWRSSNVWLRLVSCLD
jgi:hypothetical protein